MILCDREIEAALARGAVKITPPPPVELFSSTAVDLRLGDELRIWKPDPPPGVEQRIRIGSPQFSATHVLEGLTETWRIPTTGYDLKPHEFVLGWTLERIQLPHRSRLAARVEGKSSLARLGVGVHVTAPTIHAGFGYDSRRPEYEGSPLQLEIWDPGKLTLVLEPGIRICQLIFEYVDGTPNIGYGGQFNVQGPT